MRPLVAGWHEAIALHHLGLDHVYAKLDTGSDRSSLHARSLLLSADESSVEFSAAFLRIQKDCTPFDSSGGGVRRLRADVVDVRIVRSSNGTDERRPVIDTILEVADQAFPVRLSLHDRKGLRFGVLLGRDALRGRFLVDAARAHLLSGAALESCCARSYE